MGLPDPRRPDLGGAPISGRAPRPPVAPAAVGPLSRFFATSCNDNASLHAEAALALAGDLRRLFALPAHRLRAHGLPAHLAELVEAAADVRRALLEETPASITLGDRDALSRAIVDALGHRTQEVVVVMAFDRHGAFIGSDEINAGTRDTTQLCLRTLVHRALDFDADAVVLAHNHPSGVALPSKADLALTRRVAEVLRAIGIEFDDHLIVGARSAFSMRREGLL